MLNVFFTVDVEIWCDGWNDIDRKFPDAFKRYIYGPTHKGDYALPIQLKILQDHGLKGVFFVEPLFSTRFGSDPLQEIVGLINEAEQEIQLHLHTEWVNEALVPLIPDSAKKRQHIKYFSLSEQEILISKGIDLLVQGGSDNISAFRAGSFGANQDTLKALGSNKIGIDSSYNYISIMNGICEIETDNILFQPQVIENIYEYPLSVYSDRKGHFRHAQLGACSSNELINMLMAAVDSGWNSFTILSHNFELLNKSKSKVDNIVFQRFLSLCKFLEKNRDLFNCTGFSTVNPNAVEQQPEPIKSNVMSTAWRMAEQAVRRIQR